MLRNVALGLSTTAFEQRVISLTTREPIGSQLDAAGVAVMASGGKSVWRLAALMRQARRWVADWRPDVVHCWMYHANVFGRVLLGAAPAAHRPAYLASIRGALNSPAAQRRSLRAVRWLDARTSRAADALLFNSRVSAEQHQSVGYSRDRTIVIPNGFDTQRFAPNDAARARIRGELESGDRLLVGMVARFEPVKGHAVLLRAVAQLSGGAGRYQLVLAGRGCDAHNTELAELIRTLGIGSMVTLLGERRDIPELLNAFDVAVCPSLSESFPNAVGEAMSSGIPCVVTDVGDCAFLLGDAGRVVRPADPQALAAGLQELIKMSAEERQVLGRRARTRVIEHFSMPAVLDRYAELYRRLVGAARR